MTTIYYIGDSTVAKNTIHTYPQTGMSQGLDRYIGRNVRIESHAKNGRSTRSFLKEGRFAPVEQAMGKGDFLLIQFCHNDEKPDKARHTDPNTSFQENLKLYVRAAQKAEAYPVLITPIARRLFDGTGAFLPGSHGAYPEAIRKVGRELGVPVIDLPEMTETYLPELGDEESRPLFVWPKDNTHLKPEGAVRMAGFLAEGLKNLGGVYAALLAGPQDGAE